MLNVVNTVNEQILRKKFLEINGSSEWVDEMIKRRPYADEQTVQLKKKKKNNE